MKSLKQIFVSSFLFMFSFSVFANEKISICTDANFWYPFTFVKDKQAAGLHIDIISKALNNLGYQPKYTPLPWKQCLKEAREGKYDAVATLSYKDDRAIYLNFPAGAAIDIKSPFRITQVEYVVITPATNGKGEKNSYVFNGQLKNIPEPVRIPDGYSIVEPLEREGLKVQEGKDSAANFKALMNEKRGSIIDLADVAKYYLAEPEFKDKFTIQTHPLVSKSYYLAFTKEGKIKLNDAEKIWSEISKIRDNAPEVAEFLKKY